MLGQYQIQPNDLAMFIGYGGKDQFNIDAQVESFLAVARERGLPVAVSYVPNGKHDYKTAFKIVPDLFDWLNQQLRPYAP
jgi:S-formylglutathione hydrolase FrmB